MSQGVPLATVEKQQPTIFTEELRAGFRSLRG
jgi:hypothetical protein